MKRELKFRAYNHVAKRMYYEEKAGDVFKWQNEAQIQTIMQFTGLTDSNGKEVYEGDLCIVWMGNDKQDSPYYLVGDMRQLFLDLNNSDSYYRITKVEVIGNIYENPDLPYYETQEA